MIIAGLQAQPNTGSSQVQEQKQEEPAFVTPSFLQPPGQEQSQAEIDSKKKAAEAAAAVLSKKNIQPEESKKDKNRPVSSTPVPGTPWCVVWTGDSRSFFFNPSNKQSVWEKPAGYVPLWSAVWDENHQAYYYLNRDTQESSWEKPKGFVEG